MVLSVFRVEHAIVVVEFYAIVFPLCKYISTPKSDRKSHWLWTISNHPTKIALILNSDNQKLWRKIEGLADSHPMISHIHIVLLTIRIIFVVPRNRSSGQILLHIWIVSGICIIYDDGSPVRVVFHWHYIHKNYRWEASSEDSRRGTRTFIFSPCNIIRKEDHLWWERERLSDSKIVIGRSAFIDLIVWRVIPIPCDTIFQPRYCTRMWSCHPVCARNGTNPWICACKGWHGIACRYDDVPRSKIEGYPIAIQW